MGSRAGKHGPRSRAWDRYGAVGDGVTDDTAAVRAAFECAPGSRGVRMWATRDYADCYVRLWPDEPSIEEGHAYFTCWATSLPIHPWPGPDIKPGECVEVVVTIERVKP